MMPAILVAVAGCAAAPKVFAQADVFPSSVDIRLVQDATPDALLMQVQLHSTAPFGGILSALTVTIRYEAGSGAFLGGGTSFCPEWSAFSPSPVVINNGIAYRTYNGFGLTRLDDTPFDGGCGLSIPPGTWFTVTRIPVGGGVCTEFTLGNDAFTSAYNRDYYISTGGWDVTGQVIGGPVMAGACSLDCMGVAGGTALPGTPCDDGNPSTSGDAWSANCVCAGATVFDCPLLEANIGDACDDGDAGTVDDLVTVDCVCAGATAFDCPLLGANIGDACDDGNAGTVDDLVTADCACAGTIVLDCPLLGANIGDACDDDDAGTENDVVTEACVCQGEVGTGVSSTDPNAAMSIYPNPNFTGQVYLALAGAPMAMVTVQVRDAAGRSVLETKQVPQLDGRTYALDLADAAPGYYTVRVEMGGQIMTARLIRQ